MRIAIFSDSLAPRVDGIAVAVQHLTAGLVDLGHDVVLVGPGECVVPGGQFLRLASVPTPVDGYPWAIIRRRRVNQALKQFQPNLVSVHTIGPAGLLGLSLARRHQAPVLFSWHTDIESYSRSYRIARILAVNSYVSLSLDRCPERTLGRCSEHALDRCPERVDLESVSSKSGRLVGLGLNVNLCGPGVISASLRQASERMAAVCAPSSGAADQVRRFGVRRPVFVMPTDVVPAHLGVGTDAACRAARLVPGLGVTPYLLYVGRLSREKNLELLLRAFAQVEPCLSGSFPPARLVLVGPANDARTRALLRRHRVRRPAVGRSVGAEISDRIVVLGPIPREQLGEIYRQSAAFVTPSLSETQCLSVSEAIALGTRVLVVDPRLAVDHSVGAVRVTAPEPAALAAAMTDILRTAHRVTSRVPGRVEITESLAVRLVAAAECARTAPSDTVLRWNRNQWVGEGPGSYG